MSAVTRPPRVLLFSERNVDAARWQASQYEFEDVIAEVDQVHLLAPPLAGAASDLRDLATRAVNTARRKAGLRYAQPIARQRLEGEYDLFFSVFHFPQHLSFLDRITGWRERCRKAACFLLELWTPDIEKHRRSLELLKHFDHIYVFNGAVAERIAELSGRPCTFLPAAVDMRRFTPLPEAPPRVIDVYSFGRRSEALHRQLADMAARRELFYVFDTTRKSAMMDYRDHRAMLASFVQRSRYAISYRINENEKRRGRTGGDEGLTTRLFELTAGGAVLLGSRTPIPEYDANFDWPDATIEIPYAPADARALLAELDAQPERVEAARRNNIVNTLRRHDWVHRWGTILDGVGLPHTAAMRERAASLAALAATVDLPASAPLLGAAAGGRGGAARSLRSSTG